VVFESPSALLTFGIDGSTQYDGNGTWTAEFQDNSGIGKLIQDEEQSVFELTLTVKSDAPPGARTVTAPAAYLFTGAANPIIVPASSVGVVIDEKQPDIMYGDVNNDTEINLADLVMLRRYFAGVINESGINLEAANVNGDGELNLADLVLFRRYFAGVVDTLGPQ